MEEIKERLDRLKRKIQTEDFLLGRGLSMIIRNMFQEDINRQINGVIKVDQSSADVTRQEVKEYVITKELKKHLDSISVDSI